AIEVGRRDRSLDAEHQPIELDIVADLPAADHAGTVIVRHRVQRREEGGGAEVAPAHVVAAIADLPADIESSPGRGRDRRRRRAFDRIGKIGWDGGSAPAQASDEDQTPTGADKHRTSPHWSPPPRRLRKTLAKQRLCCGPLSTRLINFDGSKSMIPN